MEMGKDVASIAYSGNPPLIARIGVSASTDPTWPKAILTALAARPICGARYTDRRKAELSAIASSVQRRLEAIEELATQLQQHSEEANRQAFETLAEFSGDPKTVMALAEWRHAVLHRGALSPILWGPWGPDTPDASGAKQREFGLSVPASDGQHISFDDLTRCRQLVSKALAALESDLIERINREA